MNIIFPPHGDPGITGPVVFLAGPIQGAVDWQFDAINFIYALNRPRKFDISIASPRQNKKPVEYAVQVDWETYWLNRAAREGVILFWMAKEAQHFCDRAFAQTTRVEFGEWKTKHIFTGCKLAVGIEAGFTNERYIRHRMQQDCPEIPIYTNLADTCKAAVALC